MLFVLQRVFYALDDTRTAFFLQLFQSVVFVAGLLLVALLPAQWVAVGIAAMMSLSGTLGTIVAAVVLRRRLGGFGMRAILGRTLWFLGGAVVAGTIGAAAVWALGGYSAGGFAVASRIGAIVTVTSVGSLMAIIYIGLLAATRNRELRALAGRLHRRDLCGPRQPCTPPHCQLRRGGR